MEKEISEIEARIILQLLDQFGKDLETTTVNVATLVKFDAYANHVAQMEKDPLSVSQQDRYFDFLRYNAEVYGGQ